MLQQISQGEQIRDTELIFGPMLTFSLTVRMILPFPIERDAKIESDVGKVKSYDTSEL